MTKVNASKAAGEAAADAAKENAAAAAADNAGGGINLVVCAYEGTDGQLSKVWERTTGVRPVVITVKPDEDIRDILAGVIADSDVSDDFIFVPANCVPCAPISIEELATPLVFVDARGGREFGERLPKPFSKERLVEMLPADGQTAEEFLKDYFKRNLHRPVEAGFRFGNIVTPVYRANPCEHIVIEAFVRKKFVFATPEGYAAITHLIDRYLLNE